MFVGENPLKHAAALTIPGTGVVTIPIIQDNSTPISSIEPSTGDYITSDSGTPMPTSNQIAAVYEYVTAPDQARKGLTDAVAARRHQRHREPWRGAGQHR
jgi:hypothetical protein